MPDPSDARRCDDTLAPGGGQGWRRRDRVIQTIDQAKLGRLFGNLSEVKMLEVYLALHLSLGLKK